jgi:F-type H+-transporting ATPase subunit delta
MSLAVAQRYARAFVDVVMAQKLDPAALLDQIDGFEELFRESPPLRGVLTSPAVASARKRAVIERLTGRIALSPAVRNFLMVISDHRRFGILARIREAVASQLDERMGFVRVRIASARPLEETQRAGLEDALAGVAGGRVRCDYAVDPNLLGGAVARIGSTIYDGSLRGRLAALGEKLTR